MTHPPQKLGRYEILEEIGKGAMGVVYLARDPLIGRQVALKTFRVGFSAKDQELAQFRSRFVREAQSAGILSHPNIVTIHDVVDEGNDGVCFIAMEYVKGTNLKQLLQKQEPIAHAFVVNVVSQIAEALDYAHSRGVVHRDVKPANILITPDDKVKITDFGIARLDTSNLTMEGQLLGTPNYMAPEQIQGKEVDHRADIFSLGVVFYEMLTRKKPFQGENLTAVTHKIVYEPFTPPEELVADLPGELAAVLRRCLEKDPNRRYPRAAEIATELRKYSSRSAADDDDTSATQEVEPVEERDAAAVERDVDSTRPSPETAKTVISPRIPVPPPPALAPPPAPVAIEAAATLPPTAASPASPPLSAPGSIAASVGSRPAPAIAVAQSSSEVQVSTALRRMRKQRMVQIGIVALALVTLVGLGLLWISERDKPAPTTEDPAAATAALRRAGLEAALRDARERLDAGDLAGAIAALGRAEMTDPANPEVRAMRDRITNRSTEIADAAARDQRTEAGLVEARAAFAAGQFEAAIAAATAVLEESPDHEEATRIAADSRDAMQRRKDRDRTPRPAPVPSAPVPTTPVAAPVAAVARPVAPPPVVSGDATLAVEFSSDASEGVLTVYAGEKQIVRESFKFVKKTGFLRSEKVSGSLSFERTLPAGKAALRVYVSLPGKATKSTLVEGTLAGGGRPTLRIVVDADGVLEASLD